MKRKILSLVLVTLLVAGLFSGMTAPARAAELMPSAIGNKRVLCTDQSWMIVNQKNDLVVYAAGRPDSGTVRMTGVRMIAQLDYSTDVMVLKTDGSLWCLGEKGAGQLSQPTQVLTGVNTISDEYALKTNGEVYYIAHYSEYKAFLVGKNAAGLFGNVFLSGGKLYYAWRENEPSEDTPVSNCKAVFSQPGVSYYLDANGDLWSKGYSLRGEVGNGTSYDHRSVMYNPFGSDSGWFSVSLETEGPVVILSDVADVWTADEGAVYAVKKDGTIWKWGDGHTIKAYLENGNSIREYKYPEDLTGWAPRQVSVPDHWDVMSGDKVVRFGADGSLSIADWTRGGEDGWPSYSNWTRLQDWAADPGNATPFTDVRSSADYYDAVKWALDKGITDGMDATHFCPDATVTRGQCVTFLWRAMGCPEPAASANPFVDVAAGQYFFEAVLWAVEKGITNGVDGTHFDPNGTLSTQHIITFLFRTRNPGRDGWNGEAAQWAKKKDPNGQNRPFGVDVPVSNDTPCPRAHVVQFLYAAAE